MLAEAVDLLVQRGAERIVHCGDLEDPESLAVLAHSAVPCFAVAGNMDRRIEPLARRARECGVCFGAEAVIVPLGGKDYLSATHGHDRAVVRRLLSQPQCRYLCLGHTHRRRDERIGDVRVINPGAVHRAHPRSVALLDTDADTVEFIELR